MTNLDDFIHLSANEILSIHDSILDGYAGLKGSRPDLSVDALVGRIHSNLAYQQFHSLVVNSCWLSDRGKSISVQRRTYQQTAMESEKRPRWPAIKAL